MSVPADQARKFDLEPQQVTAVLVGLKSRAAVFVVQRWVAQYEAEPLLAVLPGVALDELWQLLGVGEQALLAMSVLVAVVSLASLVAVVLAGLNERRRELAILRALGAGPLTLCAMLTLEGLLIASAGVLAGLLLVGGATIFVGPWLLANFGIVLSSPLPGRDELLLVAAIIGTALLVSLIPGWRAWRMSLADGLTPRR